MHRDLLFVQCDGGSSVLPGTRRELNRHVQHRRQHESRAVPATPALPRQIRYRTFTRSQQTVAGTVQKQKRARKGALLRRVDPWTFHLPLYRWSETGEGDLQQYYLNVVANQLFGDKRTQFWEVHILQKYHQVAVVRESLLSLSAAFRHSHQVAESSQYSACVSYLARSNGSSCKAVSMLRAYMQHEKNPSHSIVLTCAIILHAQAKLVRDDKAASWHLETAITILETWARLQDPNNPSEDFAALRTSLSLLDLESTLENATRRPRMIRDGPAVTRFHSLDEMMYEQSMECRDMMLFAMTNYAHIVAGSDHCPRSIIDEKHALLRSLQAWKAAADEFIERKSAARESKDSNVLSPRDKEAYASVMLQYHTSFCQQAMLLAPEAPEPSHWDTHAQDILHWGEQVLLSRRANVVRSSFDQPIRYPTLIVTYAQALRIFAQGTTDPVARAKAMDIVAEAESHEQVVTIECLLYLGEGSGIADAMHSMDQTRSETPAVSRT